MAPQLNTQQMLAEMRAEQREDHKELAAKVDSGFDKVSLAMNNHELDDANRFNAIDNRLMVVENTRKSMRWLGATVISLLIGAGIDFAFVHLPRLLAAKP